MEYKTIRVVIKPNSTIEALIRHYNQYSMDRKQIDYLLERFNSLNPEACPPKPGQSVIMPVLTEHMHKHEN